MLDLVVRGGLVVDGSGLAGYRADVGIIGDRIAHVGRITASGRPLLIAIQVVPPSTER